MFASVGIGALALGMGFACTDRPISTVKPRTTNLYVEPIHYEVIDKIDLLFMIDNSASMGDKQALLAKAVPQLLDRLAVPRCVGTDGQTQERSSPDAGCPSGSAPEFRAVQDIHVAVISSSLGGLGAGVSACEGGTNDDRARLLPTVRSGLSSYDGRGFLAWDPAQTLQPPGERDRSRLGRQFGDMVRAAGEEGCGFEASLESWYRFLIDPEPPLSISVGADGRSLASGVDQDLLAQRAAFLRPDSLVAIVMLTDENDCSIRDDEFGNFLATDSTDEGERFLMPRGSSACERDPNDPCCLPCTVKGEIPAGCTPLEQDAACQSGARLTATEDQMNLRCLENKRRYGYDFLQPVSRYIAGLTEPKVVRRSNGELADNPLFQPGPGGKRRTRDSIYLAGIVGVPWQDVADDASRSGAGLRYLTASQLQSSGRWDVILGDPGQHRLPTDPFMHESTAPRSGSNPITHDPIVPATSTDPQASPINGHEQIDAGDDLQYACTFRLEEPEPCLGQACDCNGPDSEEGDETARNRPLCQPPQGGNAETTQYFGKAYPGLRPLEVLRGIGDSAIVASICPKVLTLGQPGYGYEPAVDAIVDRLKVVLNGRCPPRPLAVQQRADGKLPCVVVEALPAPSDGSSCSCSAPGRSAASASAQALVQRGLAERHECGEPGTPACSAFCFCQLAQAEGETQKQCLNDPAGSSTPGYCYVDPFGDPPQGNPALVSQCGDSKRLIRFVGPDTPTPGATAFLACLGATAR
jgi:hypothetical protein